MMSKPWAEPLGADAVFLFSCRETEETKKIQRAEKRTNRKQGQRRSHLRWDALRWFDPDAGVPLARRKHRDLIQELIDPRQQVGPVLRFVGHIVENLQTETREHKHFKTLGLFTFILFLF